jgi:purine-binding chemotaxis protein CheW
MKAEEGKYLTFNLKNENYGIPLGRVKEIIAMLPITEVPKTPDYIKGVINLRGKIIPIMDLRLKFGLEEKEYNDRTCIIVVDILSGENKRQTGLAVDSVAEVVDIKSAEIEEMSSSENSDEDEFIIGIGKVKEKVVMLLDIDKILSREAVKILGMEVGADV